MVQRSQRRICAVVVTRGAPTRAKRTRMNSTASNQESINNKGESKRGRGRADAVSRLRRISVVIAEVDGNFAVLPMEQDDAIIRPTTSRALEGLPAERTSTAATRTTATTSMSNPNPVDALDDSSAARTVSGAQGMDQANNTGIYARAEANPISLFADSLLETTRCQRSSPEQYRFAYR